MKRAFTRLLLLLAVIGVCTTLPAYAYIDPNAAGLASQILTPLLVIVGAGLTFFRKQVGALFSNLSGRFRRRADDELTS